MGDLEQAEANSLAAIENFRLTGQRLYESYALSRLATIYRRTGKLLEAEDAAQRSMAVREELGDQHGIAASLITLSNIAAERGDLTRSLQYAQQAEDIGTAIDDTDVVVSALLKVAKAELLLQRPRDAAGHYAAAEAIAINNEDRVNVFAARYGIAKSRIAIGDYASATAIADELLADARANNGAVRKPPA